MIEIYSDQELPTIPLDWRDRTGTTAAFASGWTATVKVCAASAPTTVVLTKTTGITLADTAPNYDIEFSVAELATLTTALSPTAAGVIALAYPYIRRSSDSKDNVFPGAPIPFRFKLAPA